MTPLQDKLDQMLGPVLAYDGRYLIWVRSTQVDMTRSVHDLRDIRSKLGIKGVTLDELRGALPKFNTPKRRKSTSIHTEEEICTLKEICTIPEPDESSEIFEANKRES